MSTAAKDAIVRELPYLRRYARALTGSQEQGDRYVRVGLERLVSDPKQLKAMKGSRREVYRLFHELWQKNGNGHGAAERERGGEAPALRLERALDELALPERQILILVSLENFSVADAAGVMGIKTSAATELLERAKQELTRVVKVDVLIIEDEALIALAIGDIVREMGHNVVGVASRAAAAVELARQERPGLVLADVQLEDGSSGIDAVREILRTAEVPVIFVTAHPELLLTGEAEEPTFLLTKPFEPLALKTAISQALATRNAA
jgi:CheY-like chemotaxis protein